MAHGPRPIASTTALTAPSASLRVADAVFARAISTMSYPGHGPPARLTASLNTRLLRLRRTAPPSLLPATKATRPPGPRPFSVSRMIATATGWSTRAPPWKTSSISRLDRIIRNSPRPALAGSFRQTAPPGPCGAGSQVRAGPLSSTSAAESRGSCCACAYWVGRSSSRSLPPLLAPRREQSPAIISALCQACQSARIPPVLGCPGCFRIHPLVAFELRVRFEQNLWTLWKNQDLRLPNLWTTQRVSLLALGPSARLGPARKSTEGLAYSLKNACSKLLRTDCVAGVGLRGVHRSCPRPLAPLVRSGYPQTGASSSSPFQQPGKARSSLNASVQEA